ncbi:hypothetical protein C1Y23_34965 [Pseudomonas sp. GW460-12]|nr:hypothetical protein C1Y23_34965 [Pseudomonas sp. GW460-12]
MAVAPRDCDVVAIGEVRGFAAGADPDSASEFINKVRRLSRNAGQLQDMGRAALAAVPEYERHAELRKLVEIVESAARP